MCTTLLGKGNEFWGRMWGGGVTITIGNLWQQFLDGAVARGVIRRKLPSNLHCNTPPYS